MRGTWNGSEPLYVMKTERSMVRPSRYLCRSVLQWAALLGLLGIGLTACAGSIHPPHRSSPVVLGHAVKIVEGPYQVSPPALHFGQGGVLHLAWFEKREDRRALRAVRVTDGGKTVSPPVQVNPAQAEPDALHQAPGLATGPDREVYVTWSTPRPVPGAFFAANLRLARSLDDGLTFEPPLVVNDDDNPINHSFEQVSAGSHGDVYLAWLDNRDKEKSGAGAIFACSRDGGKTVGKNLTVDGMACICCRPSIALAPDGTLWVAWRKTFERNVRDIVLAKSIDQGQTFSTPILVKWDGWAFPACPHRGPSLAFDRFGRLYIGWYTEGTDEQPRLLLATSDDQGKTFSDPISLHTSTTSLPDQLRMVVHSDGIVVAVWEEVTGVRKRVVMRTSVDRGRSFGRVQALSEGAKAEAPMVAVHPSGLLALSWTEHAWPNNRIMLQHVQLDVSLLNKQP